MEEGVILEDIESSTAKMEQIIIQTMFKKEEVRNTLLPYLSPEIFQNNKARKLYSNIDKFMDEFQTFPTISDINLQMVNNEDQRAYLKECFVDDISQFNQDHILKHIENYMKKSLYQNALSTMMGEMIDPNFQVKAESSIPEDLRNIFSFSFDTSVGMNLFSDNGMKRMLEFFHQASTYIESGIVGLDAMLNGGFHAKTMSLFMLPTNGGKSAIMCALASNMIKAGRKVLYVTLEMSEEMISHRIMANTFDVDQNTIKKFDEASLMRKFKQIQSQCEDKLRVKEYPTSTMNSNVIRRLLKELKEKQDYEPEVIFIDYLELMKPNHSKKASQKHEDLRTVSEELRDIGLEYDLPVISAVQTNREGYAAKELDLNDISGSYGIAMTADFVVAGILTPESEIIKEYTWRCVKNRFGAKFQEFNVGIDFAKMQLLDLGNLPTINGELVLSEDKHNKDNSNINNKIDSIITQVENEENRKNFAESIGEKEYIKEEEKQEISFKPKIKNMNFD